MSNLADEIAKLGDLLDRGLIDQTEFQRMKETLLSGSSSTPATSVNTNQLIQAESPITGGQAESSNSDRSQNGRRASLPWIAVGCVFLLAIVAGALYFVSKRHESESSQRASSTTTASGPATTNTKTPPTTAPQATPAAAAALPANDPNDGLLDGWECDVTRQLLISLEVPAATINIGCDAWASFGNDLCGQIAGAGGSTEGLAAYERFVRASVGENDRAVKMAVRIAAAAASNECDALLEG